MRVLHSSDWHLGRSFGHVSLHDDQCAFVDWFVEVAITQAVHLVIIAGDVYDRAISPPESISLFRSVLVRLRAADIAVVVISGNHDGPERVAAYDGLLDASGVHVRGGYNRAGEVIRLDFADGPVDIVAVPYLDPVLEPVVDALEPPVGEQSATPAEAASPSGPVRARRPTHHEVLDRAIERGRSSCTASRSIAVAHAFVVAGGIDPQVSDSERQLTVGGTGGVAASIFDGFSYTALGHLHTAQTIGSATVRYSGTPLAYSFSETTAKTVAIIDLDANGVAEVTEVPVPVGRGVATITGDIDQLIASPVAVASGAFVRAIITDVGPVIDARARLQVPYPGIVEIELRPRKVDTSAEPDSVAGRRMMTPYDAAGSYWNELWKRPPDDDERAALIHGLEAVGG